MIDWSRNDWLIDQEMIEWLMIDDWWLIDQEMIEWLMLYVLISLFMETMVYTVYKSYNDLIWLNYLLFS